MITATARPWKYGWEIEVDDYGYTQVRVLSRAAQQVLDYVSTVTGVDVVDEVTVRYDLDGLEKEVRDVQHRLEVSADEQARAAADMRGVVARLREQGVSVSDIGTILGRTRGRVSQLLAGG